MITPDARLVTVAEAAAQVGATKQAVNYAIGRGYVTAFRFGPHTTLVDVEEVRRIVLKGHRRHEIDNA